MLEGSTYNNDLECGMSVSGEGNLRVDLNGRRVERSGWESNSWSERQRKRWTCTLLLLVRDARLVFTISHLHPGIFEFADIGMSEIQVDKVRPKSSCNCEPLKSADNSSKKILENIAVRG